MPDATCRAGGAAARMPVTSAASAFSLSSIGFMSAPVARRDTGYNSTGVMGSSFLLPMHGLAWLLQSPQSRATCRLAGGAANAASADAPAHQTAEAMAIASMDAPPSISSPMTAGARPVENTMTA